MNGERTSQTQDIHPLSRNHQKFQNKSSKKGSKSYLKSNQKRLDREYKRELEQSKMLREAHKISTKIIK